MKTKRRPTRRDLLIVISRLQGLIGSVMDRDNDRNPNRKANVDGLLNEALDLCVEARSYDPPISNNVGPWGQIPEPKSYI